MNSIFSDRLSPRETANILGVTIETLNVWRCTRRYPLPFVKIGGRVFYKGKDIQKFIDQRTFCINTMEGGQ